MRGPARRHSATQRASANAPFRVARRSPPPRAVRRDERRALAAGALNALGAHRRAALWRVEGAPREELLSWALPGGGPPEASRSPLTPMSPTERVQADFGAQRLTAGPTPWALCAHQLPGIWRAARLPGTPDGARVKIAGQVICRQRPGTAHGVVFISLEDETGIANAIVAPSSSNSVSCGSTRNPILRITGRLQHRDGVIQRAGGADRAAPTRCARPA